MDLHIKDQHVLSVLLLWLGPENVPKLVLGQVQASSTTSGSSQASFLMTDLLDVTNLDVSLFLSFLCLKCRSRPTIWAGSGQVRSGQVSKLQAWSGFELDDSTGFHSTYWFG